MCCLRYCKSTIFQANHNRCALAHICRTVVCDTAKVRFFKQITTAHTERFGCTRCLRYCKSTIFQANHNVIGLLLVLVLVVCDTAKVRFFKQITTTTSLVGFRMLLFAILQKYDFSSKSQLSVLCIFLDLCCLRYCKSTIFQANHNEFYEATS